MATVNPNDPRPPYVQIADDLRSAITGGTLKPGDRIGSGRELAKRYGVAPMTVTNAISALRDEGLLTSWQGRGVFVADPLPATGGNERDRLARKLDVVVAEVEELRGRVAALENERAR